MTTSPPIDEVADDFRRSYQAIVDQAPLPLESPPSGRLEPGLAPTPPRAVRGAAIAASVILMAMLGLALFRPGGPLFTPATVEYLRLQWSQEIEPRCMGMDINDNQGFDEATIEVWGPSPDQRWRFEVAFPDGSGFVNITEGDDVTLPWRVWSNTEPFPSPFREASCSVMIDGEGFDWSWGNSPLVLGGFQENDFLAFSPALVDQLDSPPEPARWRGIDVVIHRTEASGEDENGRFSFRVELWVDQANVRLERKVIVMDWETLGRTLEVMEVTDRGMILTDQVSFSTEAMRLVMERPPVSEISEESEAIVTTTSIPALSHPLATGAVRVDYADLPTDQLRELVAPTDLLWSISVGDNELFLAARPGQPPLLFGTACSILASIDLPGEWEGLCLEMTVDGTRKVGVFTYEEAVAAN